MEEKKWLLGFGTITYLLGIIASQAGWIVAEVGRQPWVVYEVMRTEAAVTGADGIVFGYGALAVVYAALFAAVAWVLVRLARKPLPPGLDSDRAGDREEADRIAG